MWVEWCTSHNTVRRSTLDEQTLVNVNGEKVAGIGHSLIACPMWDMLPL